MNHDLFKWLKSKVTRRDRTPQPKVITTTWRPKTTVVPFHRQGVAKATSVPYGVRRARSRRRNVLAKASRRANRGK